MGRVGKKELVVKITDPNLRMEFLDTLHKKMKFVDLKLSVKGDNIYIMVTGTRERTKYAISFIKSLREKIHGKK